jgi:hypothetical protein
MNCWLAFEGMCVRSLFSFFCLLPAITEWSVQTRVDRGHAVRVDGRYGRQSDPDTI